MRWLTFAILTVLALTLQSAAAPRLELFSARPDFLLIVVVFLSLYAPSRDAIAAAWILGVCADLMTIERFGVIALSYGMTAMIVASLREYLFRYRVMTQTVVTLTVCLLVRTAWTMYYHLLYKASEPLLRDWLIGGVIASAYTAVLAPFAFRVLLRVSRPLGIARPRYGYAGVTSRGRADV
ncbi:MAG: rod shape-determining protein MreD [Gammaproteobacteria bacterium]